MSAEWEIAIIRRLQADAAVSAYCGDRIYWDIRPQDDALPAIVATLIADPRPQNYGGFNSVRESRVQFDVIAASASAAAEIQEALIAALAGPFVQSGVEFQRMFFDLVRSVSAADATGAIYGRQIDAQILHN